VKERKKYVSKVDISKESATTQMIISEEIEISPKYFPLYSKSVSDVFVSNFVELWQPAPRQPLKWLLSGDSHNLVWSSPTVNRPDLCNQSDSVEIMADDF
jgi:hypothetical protein